MKNEGARGDLPLRYVLITPARNEAEFIEQTIQSVLSQTILPIKWIIVSDGSNDGTDEIVNGYSADRDWIELWRLPDREQRNFAGKAHAFNSGLSRLGDLDYDIIGNLDADISFQEGYFAYLLSKFLENPRLGVAGTPFREDSGQYDYRFTSMEHVSGACQMFRRACFESIGGYVPLRAGGIDLLAVIRARMHGWETRTFLEMSCLHHRKMGTGLRRGFRIRFHGGYHDYLMGSSLVWQVFRSIYQLRKRPGSIGGALLLFGFLWGMVTRAKRIVPPDVIRFRKSEQMHRLRYHITGWLS